MDARARYLAHAGVPDDDSRWAASVEVDLVGRLKLAGKWADFHSTLTVHALSAFRWDARVRRGLVRFSGHDLYQDGRGEMLWKLYGLLPVVRGQGADISHSARGRAALEQVFLPSALARPEVQWSTTDDGWARVSWTIDGEPVAIELQLGDAGEVRAIRMQRWSDAAGTPWRLVTFGGDMFEHATFSGLTLPSVFAAGWFYGSPAYEAGRFFEARVSGIRRR